MSDASGRHNLFSVELDRLDQQRWNNILAKFDDANLMQTWSYGSVRWGAGHLKHILLRKNSEIVSGAQAVVKTVPFLGAGICRVRGGPLWQFQGRNRDPEIFRQMLRALRDIFVNRRGLLLQIFPATLEDDTGTIGRIFDEEGFVFNYEDVDPQTALIDLSYTLDEIRRSFRSTWRRNLVLSERNNLTIRQGRTDDLFDVLVKLYVEGLRRRCLTALLSPAQLKEIQRSLPEAQKMRVMLCEYQGEPISGIAVSFLGSTGQVLLSGTGEKGIKLRGSYLVHWRMLEWLKEHGCAWYDLDGINPTVQSGDTQFKIGLTGNLGLLPKRLGRFENFEKGSNESFVRAGLRLRRSYTGMRTALSGVPGISRFASRVPF